MKKRPNIIIFNPDQMRSDALRHLGNTASITPNLDKFAETDAVSFRNAFCQNPVCVPSRSSFLTGLYPHTNGHRTMGHLLHEHETTLLKELKESGYYVWANARNDLVAGQIPELIESHVTELYYGGNKKPSPGPVNPRENDPNKAGYYSFYTGELKLDENEQNYSPDDEDLDAAIERILNPIDEKPLCIFLGLLYPHPPYQIEEPYFSAIDRNQLPRRVQKEETKNKARILDLIRDYQNIQDLKEEEWNEIRAVYLAMCMKIDYQFKRLCDALKQAGEYDDSAIFFLSDHGDYTGDYGLTEKTQNTFEDCLTKVPLLIKPPKDFDIDAGVTDSFAELVDFYATAMDFAECPPTHSHFGKSLIPILKDKKASVREWVFCEGGRLAEEKHCSESVDPALEGGVRKNIYWPRYAAQFDDEAHAKGTMIRNKKYKLVYRSHSQCELYDLEQDPNETCNVYQNEKYKDVINEMKGIMLEWYQDTCDVVPFEIDERFSKKMIWEKVKMICPPDHEEEVKEKIDNGMGLFMVQLYCQQLQRNKNTK